MTVLMPAWRKLAAIATVICAPLFSTALAAETVKLDSASCLSCHDGRKGKVEVAGTNGEKRDLQTVDGQKIAKSIHGDMQCVDCHQEIIDSRANHVKAPDAKAPNCITCHESLWAKVQKEGRTAQNEALGRVVQNIADYKKSFHARPNKEDPSRPMATCENCHSSHAFNVPPKGSGRRNAWHKEIPKLCGENCHKVQLKKYTSSIHGEEMLDKGNLKAAVCVDCHTAHNISNTSTDDFKLGNVNACGGCHPAELKSYSDTYHGQVTRLGFTYTARCVDCHDSHAIRAVDNPKSKVNPKNRLKTCQKCHTDSEPGMRDATAGFASFGPHANTHDFKKYPEMYVASKFMIGLLIFVFAFFWAHSLFWWYREYMDRKTGKAHVHVRLDDLPKEQVGKSVRRFGLVWRIGHLIFAVSVMVLVVTGMTAFYAETMWAHFVVQLVGSPKTVGLIHRVAAFTMLGIFLLHLIGVTINLVRGWKKFRIFGPDSLMPNRKDWADLVGMYKWFRGQGSRPTIDRWSYWEKFDYWAVFWGMFIIGGSGVMMAFPHITAQYLPGWVFNVSMLVHGEEAFLCAVFLFTVHFFNNHFRPDKIPPPDIVMFTGVQSIDEFRREHMDQYNRLVAAGELEKYLVDAPSRPMTLASRALGLVLIAFGLTLLVLVTIGFFGGAA